jgi:hypothetical protein
MFILFMLVLVILIVVIIFRVVNRKKGPPNLRWSDWGTVIDRSLRSYRRLFMPLFVLSLVLVPLSQSLNGSSLLFVFSPLFLDPAAVSSTLLPSDGWVLLNLLLGWIGLFGIGHAVLAIVAADLYRRPTLVSPFTSLRELAQQRGWALLGMVAVLMLPGVIHFLGIIGALASLLWVYAPVIFVWEGAKPWKAMEQSRKQRRRFYSAALNTRILLWCIAWLGVGTVLYGSLGLVQIISPIPNDYLPQVILLLGIVGNIFVNPLLAVGAVELYAYINEWEARLGEQGSGVGEQGSGVGEQGSGVGEQGSGVGL